MSTTKPTNEGEGLVSSATGQWLLKHKRELADLPEPGTEWTRLDVDDDIKDNIHALSSEGIINRVTLSHKNEVRDSDERSTVTVFKTEPNAYNRLQQFIERDKDAKGMLPCSGEIAHDGFENVGGEKPIKCKRCGSQHTKAEVQAHRE